jgi:hypothetical protein
MKSIVSAPRDTARYRVVWSLASLLLAGVAGVAAGISTPAYATLMIDPTYDSSITSLPGAAGIEGAIGAAITVVETDISSPNNITVAIDFTNMSSGLGESTTGIYAPTYYQYYNAFAAVATEPNQLTALASLGPAPGPRGTRSMAHRKCLSRRPKEGTSDSIPLVVLRAPPEEHSTRSSG